MSISKKIYRLMRRRVFLTPLPQSHLLLKRKKRGNFKSAIEKKPFKQRSIKKTSHHISKLYCPMTLTMKMITNNNKVIPLQIIKTNIYKCNSLTKKRKKSKVSKIINLIRMRSISRSDLTRSLKFNPLCIRSTRCMRP